MICNRRSIRFNPDKDIPSLDGKVILVTGGNVGLGKQAVLQFAKHHPKQIWLASRSLEKASAAADEIKKQVAGAPVNIKPLVLDLTSFDSIKKAAATVLEESDRLDILMLNAGIMATAPGLTQEGYEIQFGTNHMGHAFLTKLLLPLLEKTAIGNNADVRVISLASYGHASAKGGISLETPKTLAENLTAYERYFQSKLANVLWARQLAKAYPQLTVASIHPGVVQTQLMEGATGSPGYIKFLTKIGYKLLATVEDGAKNQLWASVSKDVKSGEYYEPVGVGGQVSEDGKDDQQAKKLWDWTEKELGAYV